MSSDRGDDATVFDRARAAMTAARAAEADLLAVITEIEATGAWADTGHRSIARLLAELWRLDPAHATRMVSHAGAVTARATLSGQPLPPLLPAAATATAEGAIGEEHLRVLVRAHQRIATIDGLTPDQSADAEQLLADAARALPPCALERVVTRLLGTLDPDGVAPPEDPEPHDEWQLLHRRNGTLAFTGTIHGRADVELVLETVDALATPAGPDDTRTLPERRAEALLDLCAQALSPTGITGSDPSTPRSPATPDETEAPGAGALGAGAFGAGALGTGDDEAGAFDGTGDDEADDGDDGETPEGPAGEDTDLDRRHGELRLLPDEPDEPDERLLPDEPDEPDEPPEQHPDRSGPPPRPRRPVTGRAQLVLTMPLDWLRGQIGHGLLDSQSPVSAATARRLACDAGVIPLVTGTRSEPLDLGRRRYSAPDALRRALHHRDRGCAHPGCTRRPRRTHVHHIVHWLDGGDTALGNCVLLCRYHHHLVHHSAWEIHMHAGRPWFTPPRWIDPQRRPRPGGPAFTLPGRAA